MQLHRRQADALRAICDTLLPGSVEADVPAAVLAAAALNPRAEERAAFAGLLAAWNWPLGGLGRRFDRLPRAERERALRGWRDSRIASRRAAFKIFRKATLFHAYGLPGPLRDQTGYPGPPPSEHSGPRNPVRPLRLASDLVLDCDVCVVGSGAGGGTAAGVLAAAGLEVVVLEAGRAWERADLGGEEIDGLRRLYLEGAGSATTGQSLDFLAGACLGGGSTVNWTSCFRPPPDVREEWARLGVPELASRDYDRSLDAVWQRLHVTEAVDEVTPSARDSVLERGLSALGWHCEVTPRNVRGCKGRPRCGACGVGCPLGAKQTVVETWLADAQAAAARVLVETRAERVIVDQGTAVGVEARTRHGHSVRIRAGAVVVACGAFHTPALLARSGLQNVNLGSGLRLHPVTIVCGVFDDEIRPWEGALQARYSEEHARLDGPYGVRYETAPMGPAFMGAVIPWESAEQSARLASRYPHFAPVFPLVRDRDAGEVTVGRDGEPRAHYRLSAYDRRHLRRGFAGAARILEAAGAREIFSSHARLTGYEPGRRGSLETFVRDADAAGWDDNRVLLGSAHLMGTARMGASPATAVCDGSGETWEVARLVVCDGSALPTSAGVNPMISIAALAHMNASALGAKLA